MAICLVFPLVAVPTATASPKRGVEGSCSPQRLQVEVDGRQHTVAGKLCVPSADPRGVQVLVHGASYTGQYWDWPVNPDRLSYVQDALADGYATFAYDQLGRGESDRLFGGTLTVSDAAEVLHQVVSRVSERYNEVTVVGHSLGSIIAIQEAARYNDADRLVATGLIHLPFNLPGTATTLPELLYPACLDPTIGDYGCDYTTTRPGTREKLFYSGTADPEVIAYDEAHKSVTAVGQVETFVPHVLPVTSPASGVEIPVFVVMGKQDALFCGLTQPCTESSIRSGESLSYTNTESLDVYVEPTAGHNLALHPSAPKTENAIDSWIQSRQ